MSLPTILRGLASLALIGSCAACEPAGPSGPTGLDVLEDSLDRTALPDISAFAESSRALEAEVTKFCESPGEPGLLVLQDAWRALSERWNATALYNVGPLDDDLILPRVLFVESMRQRGIDYTDTVREAQTAAVEGDQTLDEAFFDELAFTEVGMLALEVLLFEDVTTASGEPADILASYQEPRRCAVLAGMSAELSSVARAVDEGWRVDDGSGQAFRDQMLREELPDGSQPIAALIVALYEHLDYVKVRKLEGILDAQLSGHFYPNAAAMVDAYERFLDPAEPDSLGLLGLMDERGFGAEADEVRANLTLAREAAAAESREDLAAAIGLVEGNLKREVPDSLGIFLGINFSDGD